MEENDITHFFRIGGATFLHAADIDRVIWEMFNWKFLEELEQIPDRAVDKILRDGPSWRERLTALTLATMRGFERHFESGLQGFHNSGGISIVPIAAALAVAIRDRGCHYTPEMTSSIDRSLWLGEFGFAIDWLHFTIGIGDRPNEPRGPHYNQSFEDYVAFYVAITGGISPDQIVPPESPVPSDCLVCDGSGHCFCIRKGSGNPGGCPRCNESGQCRHCKGVGKR